MLEVLLCSTVLQALQVQARSKHQLHSPAKENYMLYPSPTLGMCCLEGIDILKKGAKLMGAMFLPGN